MAYSDDERRELEARKQASVGQLLFRCTRLFNERALARARERTGIAVRPAHTTLFPHLDLEGTRVTTLAERVGITKQAVGQLVAELEEMGALERVPDPTDGRAKLVRFARRKGRLSLLDGLDVLAEIERELAAEIGEDAMADLRRGLVALLPALEDGA